MLVLITGATGKVGRALIGRLQAERPDVGIRALCHNRTLPQTDTLWVVRGSIADREICREALRDVTHVVHLATCKETPDDVMDVTVKGLFWLLEEFRASPSAQRFLLIGGDAAIGHFFHRHPAPITEDAPHMAYPGCYALSKVLEEVMLEQFGIQYGIDWCCLRAPWIMEKDDFRHSLSFGDDLFGGPDWKTMVEPEVAGRSRETGAVPLLQEEDGTPVRRNFVHVDDLVAAILVALTAPPAPLQHLHGRAGRLRRGGRSPRPHARSALHAGARALRQQLDGQRPGQGRTRLAPLVRPFETHRFRLGLRAAAG